jgi:hypothetical protein
VGVVHPSLSLFLSSSHTLVSAVSGCCSRTGSCGCDAGRTAAGGDFAVPTAVVTHHVVPPGDPADWPRRFQGVFDNAIRGEIASPPAKSTAELMY